MTERRGTHRESAARDEHAHSRVKPSVAEAQVSSQPFPVPVASACNTAVETMTNTARPPAIHQRPALHDLFSPRAKPGAARARIALDLRIARGDCLASDERAESASSARAHRLPRRTDTIERPFAHRVLDDPVFAGVIGDDGENTAVGSSRSRSMGSADVERFQLVVHRNAQPPERFARNHRPLSASRALRELRRRDRRSCGTRDSLAAERFRARAVARAARRHNRERFARAPASSAVLSTSAARFSGRIPMRMSSGAPSRNEKPRDSSSN